MARMRWRRFSRLRRTALAFGIHHDALEEGVDGTAQGGHRRHRGAEILGLHRGGDPRLRGVERVEQRALGVRLGELPVRPVGILDPVLRLGLREDIGRPPNPWIRFTPSSVFSVSASASARATSRVRSSLPGMARTASITSCRMPRSRR
jgi:hypothetical protein